MASSGPIRRSQKVAASPEEDVHMILTPVVDEEATVEIVNESNQEGGVPVYSALPASALASESVKEVRRIQVPPNRLTPLRDNWVALLQPLVTHFKLQVRMNTKRKSVELRNGPATTEANALQKGGEYLRAFILGFAVEDAVALLRLDDLFIESFEIKDVKRLAGDHLGRSIGRIAGKDGKTKNAIENATRTRIVLANNKIHLLGSFSNIRLARNSICDLILGSPPSKVYTKLNVVAKRLQERI